MTLMSALQLLLIASLLPIECPRILCYARTSVRLCLSLKGFLMPPAEEVPIVDSFLLWFESLPTDVQREVLQRIFAERKLLFSVVNVAELFADRSFHIAAGGCPVFPLN
jgi:hypothetical protein